MLIGSMSNEEITRAFLRDVETLEARRRHWSDEWRRLCKRNPLMSVFTKTNEVKMKGSGNEYLLIWQHIPGQVRPMIHYFAKVMVGGGTQWWQLFPIKREAVAYTFHFFDRYQQRMGIVGDIRHVLCHYVVRNYNYLRIFHKGEMAVYGIREGIILAQNKKERVVFATFVSTDMLKETQKAAYDRIKPLLDKVQELGKRGEEAGLNSEETDTMILVANRELVDDAHAFYDLFYQEGVKVDVEGYEPPKGEVLFTDPEFAEALEYFKV